MPVNHPEVSVIIPAFNEAETIGALVREIRLRYPDFEIFVIDDGSIDGTARVAAEAGAMVYSHPYNVGNGAAIKTGVRMASGRVLVFMDADAQHDPEDIERLVERIPPYDTVIGARRKGFQASALRSAGNWVFNRLASYVSKFKVEDLTSGFRAVRADVARNLLYLLPNTYSYPTTLTLGILRTGRTVLYIPITARPRGGGKSRVRLFRDGMRFFMIITKICALYSPLRIFLPVSAGIFLVGLGYYLYTFFMWGRFTNMSALLLSTSILVFLLGLVSEQISQMRFERSEGDRFI